MNNDFVHTVPCGIFYFFTNNLKMIFFKIRAKSALLPSLSYLLSFKSIFGKFGLLLI